MGAKRKKRKRAKELLAAAQTDVPPKNENHGDNGTNEKVVQMPLASPVAIGRPRRLAKITEACKYGIISRAVLYRKLKAGTLKAYKRGGTTLIDLNSIDDMNETLPEFKPRNKIKQEQLGK